MNEKNARRTERGGPARALVAALAISGIALLIWGKLRLVTGIPRTAYAVPRERAPEDRAPERRASADDREQPDETEPR